MCNPAEQAGVDNASDSKRNNVLVSETDNRVICADTNASISEGTREAMDNHSNGSMVEINEGAVHLSSDSLIQANGVGVDHSYGTSEHFAKEVLISGKEGQEIVERVDHTREPSKTCIAMTTSNSEGDRIIKDGTHIPSIHFKDFPKTSGYICDSNLVKFEDDVFPMSAEYKRVETEPMETETLLEEMSSETKSSRIKEVKFESEAVQETSKELVGELETLAGLSDEANGQTSIKAFEALSSTSVSGGAAKAAEELSCKGAEKPETQTDMVQTDDTVEVKEPLLLEGMAVGHSTGPCTETESVMLGNNSDLSLDAKEQVLIDFDESLSWIEMRPNVAEEMATSSEESSIGVIRITMNCEQTEIETAVGSLETQNTPQHFEQMIQDIVPIAEHVETSIPTTAMSSKENSAEHVPRSFKEANEETLSEIEQEGTIVSSVQVQATDTAVLKRSSRPEFAEFFSNARGSKLEKEIEEQECAPVMAKVPLKKKLFMESPRSLRMLLFSEETALPSKKDEKHKKDGKSMEFSSKVVPATETDENETHTEHNYPAKWYENPDNGETSSAFSGPIAFSGALTYQGVISYPGQVPYSGSISHRSDSSTSTRSFAFPILASDWNSSPVKMGASDPWYLNRPRRKWYFCFCCRRPSTLFD